MRLGKHIAVIGAGVVGLAIAVKLRREGYRVSLFDTDAPGSRASAGNAALIMTAQISPLSQPGLWLKVPGMLTDPPRPARRALEASAPPHALVLAVSAQ